jgi:hypothetical protein
MLNMLPRANTETQAKLAALNRSNAIIEFNFDGSILSQRELPGGCRLHSSRNPGQTA